MKLKVHSWPPGQFRSFHMTSISRPQLSKDLLMSFFNKVDEKTIKGSEKVDVLHQTHLTEVKIAKEHLTKYYNHCLYV